MSPQEALGVTMILLGCSVPIVVIAIVYVIKQRLEHKQILAAIERGAPLSELRRPKQGGTLWIKNITIGIALLVVGIGWSFVTPRGGPSPLIALVLIGVGVAWTIRGGLNRKYQVQSQTSPEDVAGENKNCVGVCAPETLQQTNR